MTTAADEGIVPVAVCVGLRPSPRLARAGLGRMDIWWVSSPWLGNCTGRKVLISRPLLGRCAFIPQRSITWVTCRSGGWWLVSGCFPPRRYSHKKVVSRWKPIEEEFHQAMSLTGLSSLILGGLKSRHALELQWHKGQQTLQCKVMITLPPPQKASTKQQQYQ